MPLPAWAIYGGLQAGAAGWRYMFRPKRKPLAETEYGKKLKKWSEEGYYSPKAKSLMLGGVSSSAAGIAQRKSAEIRGRLEAGGIGAGSVAGIRAAGEPGREQMRIVSGARKDIELQSELSKIRAKEEYDRLMYGDIAQREAEEKQAKAELVSGVAGAIGAGYEGKLQERQLDIAETRAEAMRDYYKRGEETLSQRTNKFLMDYYSEIATPEQIQFLKNAGLINVKRTIKENYEDLKHKWFMGPESGAELPKGITWESLDDIMTRSGVMPKLEEPKEKTFNEKINDLIYKVGIGTATEEDKQILLRTGKMPETISKELDIKRKEQVLETGELRLEELRRKLEADKLIDPSGKLTSKNPDDAITSIFEDIKTKKLYDKNAGKYSFEIMEGLNKSEEDESYIEALQYAYRLYNDPRIKDQAIKRYIEHDIQKNEGRFATNEDLNDPGRMENAKNLLSKYFYDLKEPQKSETGELKIEPWMKDLPDEVLRMMGLDPKVVKGIK